jgi:hypothetical protein
MTETRIVHKIAAVGMATPGWWLIGDDGKAYVRGDDGKLVEQYIVPGDEFAAEIVRLREIASKAIAELVDRIHGELDGTEFLEGELENAYALRRALEASELPSGGDVARKTSHNATSEQLEASDE